jgi:hypothetical protein
MTACIEIFWSHMPSHGGNNPDYLHAKSLQNDSFKSANRSAVTVQAISRATNKSKFSLSSALAEDLLPFGNQTRQWKILHIDEFPIERLKDICF